MSVAIVGSGGREHALALRIAEDGERVVLAPGSDGILHGMLERGFSCSALPDWPSAQAFAADAASLSGQLAALLRAEGVDLVVIGPEAWLASGLADALRAQGFAVVGPGLLGAQLESSKAFAKQFMQLHGVATGHCEVAEGAVAARARLLEWAGAVVVKYDGLAAGKGVVVCHSAQEGLAAVTELGARYGDDARFLLEECLVGREVSVLVLTDGSTVLRLPCAQDHKRLRDNDQGPNTGGMGVVSPPRWLRAAHLEAIRACIVDPTLAGLARAGIPFRGFLYFGIMMTAVGPRLLEYNTRLGDPEAQAILPRVVGLFAAALRACAAGTLADVTLSESPEATVVVVAAAAGYPDAPRTGDTIDGLHNVQDAEVLHSSTKRSGPASAPAFVTGGGRVLSVLGKGLTFEIARDRAYAGLAAISFAGLQARMDIGLKLPVRVAVLFSGRGSNMRALLQSAQTGILRGVCEFVVAITNRDDAGGLDVARDFSVPTQYVPSKNLGSDAHSELLLAALAPYMPDVIVLAGYMRVLHAGFVRAFPVAILNIHPADTRLHKGLHGYAWAFERNFDSTMVTVHLVDEGLDTGAIIEQASVDLVGVSSLLEVEARGLAVEHSLYPRALLRFLQSYELDSTLLSVPPSWNMPGLEG